MEDRRQGWWGIAFAVLLLLAGGMVSVPTADDPAGDIVAFYAAHASIVVVAQLVGVLALVPLVAFTLALRRRAPDPSSSRRVVAAGILVGVAELATNLPPLVLALAGSPSRSAAHAWTLAGDLANAALFASLGLLVLAVIRGRASWVRWVGITVAALAFVRAVGSPLGFTALDAVAPVAFIASVVALSVQTLRAPSIEAAD